MSWLLSVPRRSSEAAIFFFRAFQIGGSQSYDPAFLIACSGRRDSAHTYKDDPLVSTVSTPEVREESLT